MLELLLKKVRQLSQEPKTLEQMALKLSEEAGETAQAVLSYRKASGSEYKQLGINDVKEECVDVILVTLAILYKLSDSDDEFYDLANKKIEKWESNIQR
ncbi:NTP pyrophosphatase (non-canonical NTP hydrolase) [Natronobacillus azotifigens]|uniref:MazG-like family protein n=1 Tax=Natronobacillus azotifigens TaxID=472978 RepID=A0A9J6RAP4_9BACI|nr:MazG-like family protein [Natronobacillus azotifigens]MCZ0702430.1 MazG-like family protein [Natronobacillus azotifigens]